MKETAGLATGFGFRARQKGFVRMANVGALPRPGGQAGAVLGS